METKYLENDIKLIAQEIHSYTTALLHSTKNLSYDSLQKLSDCYFSLDSLSVHSNLPAHEKVILLRDCHKISDTIWFGSNLFYFSSFYYAYRTIKDSDEPEIQKHFQKMNLDITAMRLNVINKLNAKEDFDSSEDNCFFNRVERCNWAFQFIINNSKEELYAPALYCMCNLLQTLFLCTANVQSQYYQSSITSIQQIIQTLLSFYSNDDACNIINNNMSLSYFIFDQVEHYNTISTEKIDFQVCDINISSITRPTSLLRSLITISAYDTVQFQSLFEEVYPKLIDNFSNWSSISDKALLLQILSIYSKNLNFKPDFELDIYEIMDTINIDDILDQVFYLDKINIDIVTDNHLQSLQSLKDNTLRKSVGNCMHGIRPEIIARESSKPHGSFEISDMEVPINYKGHQIHLCLPFKTGVEISEKTVPVNVAYQIVRPFTEFNQCVVVFVTAKKCSENLMNQIKKLKDKMHWPIAIIEERALAALLLMNNEL